MGLKGQKVEVESYKFSILQILSIRALVLRFSPMCKVGMLKGLAGSDCSNFALVSLMCY